MSSPAVHMHHAQSRPQALHEPGKCMRRTDRAHTDQYCSQMHGTNYAHTCTAEAMLTQHQLCSCTHSSNHARARTALTLHMHWLRQACMHCTELAHGCPAPCTDGQHQSCTRMHRSLPCTALTPHTQRSGMCGHSGPVLPASSLFSVLRGYRGHRSPWQKRPV